MLEEYWYIAEINIYPIPNHQITGRAGVQQREGQGGMKLWDQAALELFQDFSFKLTSVSLLRSLSPTALKFCILQFSLLERASSKNTSGIESDGVWWPPVDQSRVTKSHISGADKVGRSCVDKPLTSQSWKAWASLCSRNVLIG